MRPPEKIRLWARPTGAAQAASASSGYSLPTSWAPCDSACKSGAPSRRSTHTSNSRRVIWFEPQLVGKRRLTAANNQKNTICRRNKVWQEPRARQGTRHRSPRRAVPGCRRENEYGPHVIWATLVQSAGAFGVPRLTDGTNPHFPLLSVKAHCRGFLWPYDGESTNEAIFRATFLGQFRLWHTRTRVEKGSGCRGASHVRPCECQGFGRRARPFAGIGEYLPLSDPREDKISRDHLMFALPSVICSLNGAESDASTMGSQIAIRERRIEAYCQFTTLQTRSVQLALVCVGVFIDAEHVIDFPPDQRRLRHR
jgi:hypothetical protein